MTFFVLANLQLPEDKTFMKAISVYENGYDLTELISGYSTSYADILKAGLKIDPSKRATLEELYTLCLDLYNKLPKEVSN